jgi:hypothetical protein
MRNGTERITDLTSIVMRFTSLSIKTAHLRLIKADIAVPCHIAKKEVAKSSEPYLTVNLLTLAANSTFRSTAP